MIRVDLWDRCECGHERHKHEQGLRFTGCAVGRPGRCGCQRFVLATAATPDDLPPRVRAMYDEQRDTSGILEPYPR